MPVVRSRDLPTNGGKERAERPDCLFYFKKPITRQDKKPTTCLVWNSKIVLDYRGEPIRVLDLPLTISSKIGEEEARLECRMRWHLDAYVAPGRYCGKGQKVHNALNMHVIRFRKICETDLFDPKSDNETLETYLLTTITAEMIIKNNIKGLSDLVDGSGENP